MRTRTFHATLLVLAIILCWETFIRPSAIGASRALAQDASGATPRDNPELARLYDEDQADRTSAGKQAIDWSAVAERDRKRESLVKRLYKEDKLATGADYYHAAMILQHGMDAKDYLLAHELCVVAISRGEDRARWLAAATEDRFLMTIKRPQRFGTQYRSEGVNGPPRLYKVDRSVTDGLRRAMDVPTLAEARKREELMERMGGGEE